MINKSPAYDAAIYANTRMTDFTAQFGFVPPGAIEGATLSSSYRATYSDLSQVKNGNGQMGAYWRNLADWPLDGSTTLIDGTGEIGYWSRYLSGTDSSMNNTTYITYTMDDDYDLVGMTIYFDIPADEYATDFTVGYYNASNTLLDSETVTGNDQAQLSVELQHTGVRSINITITKWCLPQGRPRVAEIVPGLDYTFDLGNSFAMQMNEVMRPFSNNFETGEIDITFDNSDHKFDFLNPDGVFAYLREKMKLSSQIGLNINGSYDFTPSGDRYLYEIPADEQMQTASLVCRPSVAFADDDAVKITYGTTTVGAVVAGLMTQAGITDGYSVDASLSSISCGGYAGENVNINDALAAIALTAGGWWKVERDGSYSLLPITTSLASPVATITYDDMFAKPAITQNPKVTAVRIGRSYMDAWNTGEFHSQTTVYTNGTNDGSQVEAISIYTRTTTRAEEIGQLVLDYHAARRLSVSFNYRGNPALEVGDVVSVQTDYGYRDIEITEHTLILDGSGFLRGSIKGVG